MSTTSTIIIIIACLLIFVALSETFYNVFIFIKSHVQRKVNNIDTKSSEPEKLSCPDCGCNSFLDGPCGGISQNIKCCCCGKTYNYTPMTGEMEVI